MVGELAGLASAGLLTRGAPSRELGRRVCTGRREGGELLPAARARWASCLRACSERWL